MEPDCYDDLYDFNRIAKRLGVDPTKGPINMEFMLKLLKAIEKVLDDRPEITYPEALEGMKSEYPTGKELDAFLEYKRDKKGGNG